WAARTVIVEEAMPTTTHARADRFGAQAGYAIRRPRRRRRRAPTPAAADLPWRPTPPTGHSTRRTPPDVPMPGRTGATAPVAQPTRRRYDEPWRGSRGRSTDSPAVRRTAV